MLPDLLGVSGMISDESIIALDAAKRSVNDAHAAGSTTRYPASPVTRITQTVRVRPSLLPPRMSPTPITTEIAQIEIAPHHTSTQCIGGVGSVPIAERRSFCHPASLTAAAKIAVTLPQSAMRRATGRTDGVNTRETMR